MTVSHLAPATRPSTTDCTTVENLSIGQYLIRRLQDYGIADVFGIPGDYVLGFYSMLCDSPINVVGCCREDNAGFAADAYARLRGMSCVCVTYCVGGLSLANSIAGAFAEKSPVVVISGSPGVSERINNPHLHHKVRDFRTQLEVFEKLCVAAVELNDANTAFRDIDRMLDMAARFKQPVYIELPRDMVKVVPTNSHEYRQSAPTTDPDALGEAVNETCRLLKECQRPVIIAGVEIHRFGLQDDLVALAEGSHIPITATILGKSVVSEQHPLYVGLYEGAMGHEEVTSFVEESDCVLLLGESMTDINMGIYTAKLDPVKCVFATSEQLRIHHHHYHNVSLGDFIRELKNRRPTPPQRVMPPKPSAESTRYTLRADEPLKIMRLIKRLNQSLDDHTIVISDIGDALFSSTELTTHGKTEYICPAYYTSMGFAVPAALGAGIAKPGMRTIAIVGDGAFQMTGNELSTIIRHGFHTIVILLDNKGYGTERFLHPGPYNDINPWQYAKLPAIYGGQPGYEVRTEGEFDRALSEAWNKPGLSLIQVHLHEEDASTPLRRLAERLSKRV
ncbi:MAG: alpha-keto acid decarboxylase family protein [Planctomycetaceae bacterium]|nr:alpha-keto acid decarboxylase family protein [Planctomycetaceae bacterium]